MASVNEGNFVSENQTACLIFAVAGEEYGFMGCCAIVLLLLAISVECIRMSLRAKDLSGRIICCGMASIVSLQSFLNICVATGIAPKYWYTASFCQLWTYISCKSLYWYGTCIECRTSEQCL